MFLLERTRKEYYILAKCILIDLGTNNENNWSNDWFVTKWSTTRPASGFRFHTIQINTRKILGFRLLQFPIVFLCSLVKLLISSLSNGNNWKVVEWWYFKTCNFKMLLKLLHMKFFFLFFSTWNFNKAFIL